MNDPLAQLLTFITTTTQTWAGTTRTVVLLASLVWLPILTLAIAIHLLIPAAAIASTTTAAGTAIAYRRSRRR